MITQSSTTKWAEFKENIAMILNIFTPNLHVQYILSTEPTGTIPIALTSESDLAELHTRLIPLVVPPRNANGSKSKRKMKDVTVKVTDKSDDTTSKTSINNGKVCVSHIFRFQIQKKLYRERMKIKSYHRVLQSADLETSTRKELQFVRPSGHAGDVKHTPQETDLCHAGGMASPPSVM